MTIELPEPGWTAWHITWGTYGARLHGSERPTVDRKHNTFGEDFIRRDHSRAERERERLKGDNVVLTDEQCERIEDVLPAICERGGWRLRECAVPRDEGDHIHVLLDAMSHIHGKQVRELLKRWITQELNKKWQTPESGRWWAKGGSTKAVDNESYLRNVTAYVERQRTTTPK